MPPLPLDPSRPSNNKGDKEDEEDKKPGFFRRIFSKKKKKKIEAKKTEVAKQNHGLLGVFRKIFSSNKSSKKPLADESNKAVASKPKKSRKIHGDQEFSSKKEKKKSNDRSDSLRTAKKNMSNVDFDKIPLDKTQSRKEKSKKCLTMTKNGGTQSTGNTMSTTATSMTTYSSSKNKMEVTAKEISKSSKKLNKKKLKKKKTGKRSKDSPSAKDSEVMNKSPIESVKSSFRSFRKKRAKDLKKVTTFVSRPFRKKALSKMLSRLNKKRLGECATQSDVTSTEECAIAKKQTCDEVFPIPKASPSPLMLLADTSDTASFDDKLLTKAQKTIVANEDVANQNNKENICEQPAQDYLKEQPSEEDWKKKYAPVFSNKTNNGNLLMSDGRPFWHRAKKNANDGYDEDEESDDELPMNADVLNDVYDGKLVLAEMPNTPVKLDPFGPLEELKKQAFSLCTRNILMGNTIRTMINMCDDEETRRNKKSLTLSSDTKPRKVPSFVVPTQLILYDRGQPKQMTRTVQLSEFRQTG